MPEQGTKIHSAVDLQDLDQAAAFAVDGVAPRYLVAPRSVDEVAAALREAGERGWAVAPRGRGTKRGLGNPPTALDMVLDLAAVSGLVEYTPEDLTVTVRAGTRLAVLQAELAAHGQMLALDPSYAEEATIGGVLATNDSGPHRLGYGTARDLVIGTRVALLDGRVTRAGGKVVKNVTGYDLNKLYIGSLGTLAVLVEVSFKLHPLPRLARAVRATFADGAVAMAAVRLLLRSPLGPTAMVLADHPARDGALYLYVEFAGTATALKRKCDDALRLCAESGAGEVADDAGPLPTWADLLRGAAPAEATGMVRLKLTTPLTAVAAALDGVRARAAAARLGCRCFAFAGNGVIYALLDGAGVATTAAAVGEMRALARQAGGALVVQECPTALKRLLDVWGQQDAATGLDVMRRLKAVYDPRNLLNPGRFLEGI